jgi:hypothetical protein
MAQNLKIVLPTEFVALCQSDGVAPADVLIGFMADLCHLAGSNGSDERQYAQAYYDRVGYPYWKDSR